MPAWLSAFPSPNGVAPIIAADFVGNQYWANGAAVTIGDLLATAAGALMLTASGLSENSEMFVVGALDAAMRDYANSPVLFIEATGQVCMVRACFVDADTPFTDYVLVNIFAEPPSQVEVSPVGSTDLEAASPGTLGRFVISPGPDALNISVNGSQVESVSVDPAIWSDMQGAFQIGNGFRRKYEHMTRLAVYPSMADQYKAVLSTVA